MASRFVLPNPKAKVSATAELMPVRITSVFNGLRYRAMVASAAVTFSP